MILPINFLTDTRTTGVSDVVSTSSYVNYFLGRDSRAEAAPETPAAPR